MSNLEEAYDRVSTYVETTDRDLFALTRLRRRELQALRDGFGLTTLRYRGPSFEFDPARVWMGKDTLVIGRARRKNAKKVATRARKAQRHCFKKPEILRPYYLSLAMFNRLLAYQEGRCYLCGEAFTDEDFATQDHVVPRAKGGKHAGNILLAHSHCNGLKGDRDPNERELACLAEIKRRFAAEPAPVVEPSDKERRKRAAFKRSMFFAKVKRLTKAAFQFIAHGLSRLLSLGKHRP